MVASLIYLHRTELGAWEVSPDRLEWARFPARTNSAPDVIDEARRTFARSLVALIGPKPAA